MKALTKELTIETAIASKMHKGQTFIQKLKIAIDNLLTTDMGSKQRVGTIGVAAPPQIAQVGQPIERITTAPPIMKTRDPTAKKKLNQNNSHASRKNKAQYTRCPTCNHKSCTSSNLTRHQTPRSKETIYKSTHAGNRRTNKCHARAYNSTALSGA